MTPLETDKESVLVLAGDVGTLRGHERLVPFLRQCNDMGFVKVLYILGNHEAYREDINKYVQGYRDLLANNNLTNILLLENDTYDYVFENTSGQQEKVRFIGTTLWTDCNKDDWFFYQAVKNRMNDFIVIRNGDFTFTPQKSYELFTKAVGYIKTVLANTDDTWKKVLVCHHGVTNQSIDPRFKGDASNGAFVSDLSKELEKWGFDLCIHGHTHYDIDYMVGKCRVVTNQVGYPKEVLRRKFVDKVLEI